MAEHPENASSGNGKMYNLMQGLQQLERLLDGDHSKNKLMIASANELEGIQASAKRLLHILRLLKAAL